MKRFATASALALLAAAGQAQADVTPQQVWDDLEAYLGGFGLQITANETMDGSDLRVTDLSMTFQIPEEDGAFTVVLSEMTFADSGSGGVVVTYPESTPVTVSFSEDGEVEGEMVFDMTQSGFAMEVSGNPGDLLYTYNAERIGIALESLMADGETIGRDAFDVTLAMGPLGGNSHVLLADGLRTITQDMTLGDLAYDLFFDDPEGEDAASFSGTLAGVTSAGKTAIPEDVSLYETAAVFSAGLAVDAVLAHKGGQTRFKVTERAGTTEGQFSSTGGEIAMKMSGESMTYALSGTDQSIALSGPELPLPISAQMGEVGLSLTMPLAAAETPQPAAVSLLMGDFTMADMLWDIFDPSGQLPRDPATVSVDLDAQVTPFVDVMDAEQMENLERTGGMPGELNSVTLSGLVVDAVGGRITGEGAFTFDNSDLSTFDGLPRPEGQVDLQVSGANGLIDKLIAMGLMAEEDAMGARMMLSMFTVPGDAPDTASSKIEVNAQGHVLANGQRIK